MQGQDLYEAVNENVRRVRVFRGGQARFTISGLVYSSPRLASLRLETIVNERASASVCPGPALPEQRHLTFPPFDPGDATGSTEGERRIITSNVSRPWLEFCRGYKNSCAGSWKETVAEGTRGA